MDSPPSIRPILAGERGAYSRLFDLFYRRYAKSEASINALKEHAESRIGTIDAASEGFLDPEMQRDLSIKYHWGHNHPLGPGQVLEGKMGDRHIAIPAKFVENFGLPEDLSGMKVLDIGAWTGGMSLLLSAMGAEVVALEEVHKYADTVNFLSRLYEVKPPMVCVAESLYDYLPRCVDVFDIIMFSGVIYHVSDPLMSLRLAFNALKNDGRIFIESAGIDAGESICRYEGPTVFHNDKATREKLNRGGWNYFVPSKTCLKSWCENAGFERVEVGALFEGRLYASASRLRHRDIIRAGLSNRHVR